MGKIGRLFRSHNPLRKTSRQNIFFLAVFGFSLAFVANAAANEPAALTGLVTDALSAPIAGVRITISCPERDFRRTLTADEKGSFAVTGLPYGTFSIVFEAKGFQTHIRNGVVMEPGRSLFMKIGLSSAVPGAPAAPAPVLIDFSDDATQTLLSESQIQAMPSGNSIWSLIENQDLSATTNRIDVGGIWASIPALYSARGGTSWTQNGYFLNGIDTTDPVWTGTPLFYPDLFSLGYLYLRNGAHLPQFVFPGGYLDLITKEGGPSWHGSVSGYYTDRNFTATNITPALQKEKLFESHSIGYFRNANAQLSGPIVPGKLFLFTSLTGLDEGSRIAEFATEDKGRVYSGLINLKYKTAAGSLNLFWTGQSVFHPTFGAGRDISVSSTTDRKIFFNTFQLVWETGIGRRHMFKAGLGTSLGNIHSRLQEEAAGEHGEEIFTDGQSGSAAWFGRDDRSSLVLFGRGQSLLGSAASVLHKLDYGVEFRLGTSSSDRTIPGNLHLRFFEGNPLEVVRFHSPFSSKESSRNFAVFFQDNLTLANHISLSIGLHLSSAGGWVPSEEADAAPKKIETQNEIRWLNFSPRLAFRIPLSQSKTSALRISAGRYYFSLPLYLMAWGNPASPAGSVYSWKDKNKDLKFQENEAGALIRREGPGFSRIDPDIKRPYTDEVSAAFIQSLGKGFVFTLAGFYRESRDLIETLNTGVPLTSYDPVKFTEIGDDRIPNTHDDLVFTIYNQKLETLGRDFFLLTNPEADKRVTRYRGLDLTVVKKYGTGSVFFFSFTATEAIGTTSPGNTEWENDDALPGSLYDNPNAAINSKGRLRFDRAYTARIGFTLRLPLGLRVGGIAKYYDGQPFARKIIITGLNQGPFYIQAFYRGQARYEYNMTVDVRLEKDFSIGPSRLRLILDGFNIFNQSLATAENEWTGPEFLLRFATEVQSPRVFRIGVAYEF